MLLLLLLLLLETIACVVLVAGNGQATTVGTCNTPHSAQPLVNPPMCRV